MTAYTLRDERYHTCRFVFVLMDGRQRHRTANLLPMGSQGGHFRATQLSTPMKVVRPPFTDL